MAQTSTKTAELMRQRCSFLFVLVLEFFSLFKCEMNTKLVQLCFASNPHSSNWSEIHTRLQHWVKHCLPQATSETDEVYIRHIANF